MRHSQACILFRRHTIMNYTNTGLEGPNPAKAIAEIKKLMVGPRPRSRATHRKNSCARWPTIMSNSKTI
jgi:hypothetical protein